MFCVGVLCVNACFSDLALTSLFKSDVGMFMLLCMFWC